MKLSKQQKSAIKQCISDLQYYYETCGNKNDIDNLETLKIHLNTIQLDVPNIEVITAKLNPVNNDDSFRFGG